MAKLSLGKLPISLLDETVLSMTGATSRLVRKGAKAGVDFAAIRTGRRYLLVSSDPVTGVSERIGWYAVNVSANDVATSGTRPQFIESVLMLPEGSGPSLVRDVATQVHEAALELGIAVVGGHTEVTPGLKRPIVVVTAFALAERYIASDGAEEGDSMMLTKTAGLEGTSVLARTGWKGMAPSVRSRALKLEEQLSVVDEAVAAFGTGSVHAMHDCTEGGVLGAAYEMAMASGTGFTLSERDVPVARPTREVCRLVGADPLRLIGSGALLLAVERGAEGAVAEALRGVCRVTRVGSFGGKERVLLEKGGAARAIRSEPTDELWRLLGSGN